MQLSPERLRLVAATWKLSTLKSVKKHLHDFKWEKGRRFNEQQINHIELMQTIIDGEINKRVNLADIGTLQDFAGWEGKLNYKKRVF